MFHTLRKKNVNSTRPVISITKGNAGLLDLKCLQDNLCLFIQNHFLYLLDDQQSKFFIVEFLFKYLLFNISHRWEKEDKCKSEY